jgi:hypothetical protein
MIQLVLRRLAFPLVCAFLLATVMVVIMRNNCFCAAGPDSSGYMNEARMLASGRLSLPLKLSVVPLQSFTPLGFSVWGSGSAMVPTYPPGLPLLAAALGLVGGWTHSAFLVVPLTSVGALLVMILLSRDLGLSKPLSFAGALILALTPTFLFHSLVVMSDVPATFFVLLAIWCARRGRENLKWAAVAGLALSFAIAIRPTNLLLGLAIIVALRGRRRPIVSAVIGALPIGIGLLWLNATWYGSPFRTGYGSLSDVVAFAFPCGAFHLQILLSTLTLATTGTFVVLDRAVGKSDRAMLALWFGPLLLFYSMYDFCSNWTFSRFLLPALPALILGFLLFLRRVGEAVRERHPGAARLLTTASLAVVLFFNGRASSQLRVFRADDQDRRYPQLIRWAQSMMPVRSRLLAGVTSGAWFYYTGTEAVRWDVLTGEQFERLRTSEQAVTWYALISDSEFADPPFERRFSGSWKVVGRLEDVKLWRKEK